MTEDPSSSPSFQRRQALRKAATMNPRVLSGRPLSGCFTMAHSLHAAFLQAIEKRQIDAAYVYGLRLASLALELLPRHPVWKQSAAKKDKRRLAAVVDSTLQQMEVLKHRMDAEELMRLQKLRQEEELRRQREEDQQRAAEAERQKQEAIQQRLAQERERLLENHRKEQAAALELKRKEKQQSIQESALAKLQAMRPRASDVPIPSYSQSTAQPRTSDLLSPKDVPEKAHETSAAAQSQQTDNATPSIDSIPSLDKIESTSPTIQLTLTPRSSREQATIDMLYRAISNQEKRIEQIESTQIPQLVAVTKEHLKKFRFDEGKSATKINQEKSNPHRQAALQCLARKKKLQRQAEASKAAIFQMETQIFMLENAMEDRLVQSTLAEASQAMSNLQKLVGVDTPVQDFAQQLSESLAVDTSEIVLDPEEEDDLLEELQGLIASPDHGLHPRIETTSALSEEDADVLALPPAVTSPLPPSDATTENAKEESSSKTSDSVRNLLKAVLG